MAVLRHLNHVCYILEQKWIGTGSVLVSESIPKWHCWSFKLGNPKPFGFRESILQYDNIIRCKCSGSGIKMYDVCMVYFTSRFLTNCCWFHNNVLWWFSLGLHMSHEKTLCSRLFFPVSLLLALWFITSDSCLFFFSLPQRIVFFVSAPQIRCFIYLNHCISTVFVLLKQKCTFYFDKTHTLWRSRSIKAQSRSIKISNVAPCLPFIKFNPYIRIH